MPSGCHRRWYYRLRQTDGSPKTWYDHHSYRYYDIQIKVNTLQKVKKVITTIKEIDVNNEIQISFSSVIYPDDQYFKEEIKENNRKLENLCKGKEIEFINNTNIDGSCLNRSKLQLNKSGTALSVKNFSQVFSQFFQFLIMQF